jgi:alkaline phosphatase
MSQTASAVKDVRDGDTLKTILEYAEERGLSTGIISNDDRTGVTIAAVSAFYAHTNNRQRSADIFQQLLHPKFGNGVDVVIGTGLKWISLIVASPDWIRKRRRPGEISRPISRPPATLTRIRLKK